MKAIIVIFVISMFIGFTACKDSPQAVENGKISGTVLSYRTMEPIAGAYISTVPPSTNSVTDASGNFLMTDLLPNTYILNASKYGYYPNYTSVDVQSGKTVNAIITLNDSVANNHNPDKPMLLSPGDENNINKTDVQLSWTCSDPDNDNMTFDVMLDTTIFVRNNIFPNISQTKVMVGDLVSGKIYYWKIIAKDKWGATAESDIYSFTVDTTSLSTIDTTTICYFPFDNNITSIISNNLTVSSANITFVNDRKGNNYKAAYFDGTSHITVNNDPILQINNELTVSVWLKPDIGYGVPSSQGYVYFVGRWNKTGPNTSSWNLSYNVQSNSVIGSTHDGNINSLCSSQYSLLVQQWTHVAFVYKSNKSYMYINGELANSATAVAPQFSDYNLEIGWQNDNRCLYKGAMDELIIYRKALSENVIKVLASY